MNDIEYRFLSIRKSIPKNINILAVSKKQEISSIKKLYKIGHRDFGESYVQEMIQKYQKLPKDIRWHMIGKIQSNKLKYIIPFIHLIHSVQKIEHIQIINKIALKHNRIINCLLQINIGNVTNKYGITNKEAYDILEDDNYRNMKNVKIIGIMGMGTLHGSIQQIRHEFDGLNKIYYECKNKYRHNVLSMGMSKDYPIAIEYGSTIIRLGTVIFGNRK
ncbi:MAG: YggS family pyridoxal phosphate-dependent enzyme [Flavobacteriales bacterium]|jgi:pyridoxal phosphate enzyme (YggS family)|uniref:YggS family pyridoxal phosphate-dependent enzyme n=1 Tax=Blattabacterium sp. (Mastotermes darwiniensis) TaxID=39768 RepID=UPI000231DFBC|nr:YggS family pyridoxal phosphate-dependent enzyme [Blattabacterium sp. (Mastotermes darwiniensis)]AER40468.1 Pyridoxal 5'-phosphate binding protein [Blattabacterium sp. (Mastotermes darwiniensis) str. MADAR]MDR1805016.1 YggS family pyridoxal phosphate-dependent enzyme [Flavobacteriales bacterium]